MGKHGKQFPFWFWLLAVVLVAIFLFALLAPFDSCTVDARPWYCY